MSDFYNHLLHLSGKTIDHCLWLDNTGVSNWGKGKSLKNVRILDTKKLPKSSVLFICHRGGLIPFTDLENCEYIKLRQ